MSREGDCSSNSFGNWSPESQLEDVEMQGVSEVFRVEGAYISVGVIGWRTAVAR